jgi:murein DD-endopeptidase MepM/ murein hydrolase activator NlpD
MISPVDRFKYMRTKTQLPNKPPQKFMKFCGPFIAAALLAGQIACGASEAQTNKLAPAPTPASPIVAEKFAYPIGRTETSTEAKDPRDEWYNAQDFGRNDHLGEDWNKNSGGNTDCGEPVFAAADGRVVYAENAGEGWGNVVIIEHDLAGGEKIRTLYGHLEKILKTSGDVKLREQIGTIGSADGRYYCHLHFELREASCPVWNEAGPGYSADRRGWLDPSDFIDARRKN